MTDQNKQKFNGKEVQQDGDFHNYTQEVFNRPDMKGKFIVKIILHLYLLFSSASLHSAWVISAQARIAPWRVCRSVPTDKGRSLGKTGRD